MPAQVSVGFYGDDDMVAHVHRIEHGGDHYITVSIGDVNFNLAGVNEEASAQARSLAQALTLAADKVDLTIAREHKDPMTVVEAQVTEPDTDDSWKGC